MSVKLPPQDTVRGRISHWLNGKRYLLRSPVVEIGSRRDSNKAWWADIRGQIGDGLAWVGVDMQAGEGVDVVANIGFDDVEVWSPDPGGQFGSAICAEVLEHAVDPQMLLHHVWAMLRPGSWLLVTVPFGFPIHNYPDDYWRFTPSGLASLLTSAGFASVETEALDGYELEIDDHGGSIVTRTVPWHVAGVGMKPCHIS